MSEGKREIEKPWYYTDESNNVIGPVSYDELKRLAIAGRFTPLTQVIAEGEAEWKLYSEIQKAALPPIPKASSATAPPPLPDGSPLLVAKGIQGNFLLFEDKIRISRKGVLSLLTHGLKGDKEIFISRISSIQFRPAGQITSGYIQFTFSGGQEAKGGILEAARDENTVMFVKTEQRNFERIREALERRIMELRSANSPHSSKSSFEELEKLASLRDKGIVTPEEFEAKKRQLLGL